MVVQHPFFFAKSAILAQERRFSADGKRHSMATGEAPADGLVAPPARSYGLSRDAALGERRRDLGQRNTSSPNCSDDFCSAWC